MELRRRKFLGLLGAAAAEPMMPVAGPAAAQTGAYDLAVAHARKFPTVSVSGMAKRIGIPRSEAQSILRQMSQEGIVGALDPTRPGTIRAASNIVRKPPIGVLRRAQSRAGQRADFSLKTGEVEAVSDPLSAHLYDLCQWQGVPLADRCFA